MANDQAANELIKRGYSEEKIRTYNELRRRGYTHENIMQRIQAKPTKQFTPSIPGGVERSFAKPGLVRGMVEELTTR